VPTIIFNNIAETDRAIEEGILDGSFSAEEWLLVEDELVARIDARPRARPDSPNKKA
jgi:hypothetical protein